MCTLEKQEKFIELRAQGWSFNHIASELSVSKRTLVDWSREFAADIDSLRVAARELFVEKVTASREEDLNRLLCFQKDVEDELATRNFSCTSTEDLFEMACKLRKEINLILLDKPQNASAQVSNQDHQKVGRVTPCAPSDDSAKRQDSVGITNGQMPAHAVQPEDPNPQRAPVAEKPEQQPPTSDPQPVGASAHKVEGSPEPAKPPAGAQPPRPNPLEHCLQCGQQLPPLLPNGQRPFTHCQHPRCGGSLPPAGTSLRETCYRCGIALPIHGTNVERHSNKCTCCSVNLPPLDPKVPFPWVPPHQRSMLPQV